MKMLDWRVIEPSDSPWASPVVQNKYVLVLISDEQMPSRQKILTPYPTLINASIHWAGIVC